MCQVFYPLTGHHLGNKRPVKGLWRSRGNNNQAAAVEYKKLEGKKCRCQIEKRHRGNKCVLLISCSAARFYQQLSLPAKRTSMAGVPAKKGQHGKGTCQKRSPGYSKGWYGHWLALAGLLAPNKFEYVWYQINRTCYCFEKGLIFLASQDALEVMRVTYLLTESLTESLSDR